MTQAHTYIIAFYLATSLILLSTPAASQNETVERQDNVAIQGYSPVSYFEKNRPERGKPEYSAEYLGRTYYFASEDQVKTFKRNPEKYKPMFDVCPYSLALGRRVAIDPTRFKLIAGRLLLFHNSDEMDALEEWNSREDKQVLLERAKDNHRFFQEHMNNSRNRNYDRP